MEKSQSKLRHDKTVRQAITAPSQKSTLEDHAAYENLKEQGQKSAGEALG